jgi:predicted nucleotidyltransferase
MHTTEAASYLLELARRITAVYAEHPSARAILVTGSTAEGESDFNSDLDIILYYDELPAEEDLDRARERNQSPARKWVIGDRADGDIVEAYMVSGVECQFGHTTIAAWERDMAKVLDEHDITSPIQKALGGTLCAVPLYGEPLIRRWQDRIRAYPEGLAVAMVRGNLSFFPLWYVAERLAARDAALWTYQVLTESAFKILSILAGLNRVYFSTFQFKRMRRFIDGLMVKPERLADRIDELFRAEGRVAGGLLEGLVSEVVGLVEAHMPEIDTGRARLRLGQRASAWKLG